MGERRALVIGAPNDRVGPLPFLSEVVTELQRVVCAPELGACAPALPDGRDLLLGTAATMAEIESVLEDAIHAAAKDQATLFVYFVGHGHLEHPDFYLIAADTPAHSITSRTAIALGQRIKELLRHNRTVDGLMLVLDACHSGGVVEDPVPGLLKEGVQARIEFLAATRAEQVASKGCFSRSLTKLLTFGSAGSAEPELRAYDQHHRLAEHAPPECRAMARAVHLSLNGSRDAGLWLGRNLAADLRPTLAGTPVADLIARLTRDWQHRPASIGRLLAALGAGTRVIGITGGPGTGKSALLASLGRRSAGDLVGLDALVVARPGDTLAHLAPRLATQLTRASAYRDAVARWRRATPTIQHEALPEFEQAITGPLALLDPLGHQVRIGIDAADQLDTVQRRRLTDGLANLPAVTVVLTGRHLDDPPPDATVSLPDTDATAVSQLLTNLIDDADARKHINTLAAGEWLLARVLAGLYRAGHLINAAAAPSSGLSDLPAAFDTAIAAARQTAPHASIDQVLTLLAAAPTGAWLPLDVVAATLGPATPSASPAPAPPVGVDSTTVQVRDALVALGELVARAEPGRPTERIGLAHDLITIHLVRTYGDEAIIAAHTALANTLLQMKVTHPAIKAYADTRLSEHLDAAGRTRDAIDNLPELSTPADTLILWQTWHERLVARAPYPGDADMLWTRHNIAHWTGRAGAPRKALELFEQLLPDQQRVLGPNHPDTLRTRSRIGTWTGQAGDPPAALALFEKLLPDQLRVLGPDHPEVLGTRADIAQWTGRAGDPRRVMELLEQLLPDRQRVLGPNHPDTLRTRHNIAHWTGEAGDPHKALQLLEQLLPDRQRVLGPDHPDTLRTRSSVGTWTGQAGDRPAALALFEKLLPDQLRVLGPDHPDVLSTRADIAHWAGWAGYRPRALELFEQLLPDRQRVVGPDHPDTLRTRHNIAHWTGEAGDPHKALELFEQLLPDRQRVLGPNHPDVLATRHHIAHWIGHADDAATALGLYMELMPDQERILGPDHRYTLTTRHNFAHWTREAGNPHKALELLEQLLPDRQRVLGPNHPDVVATHNDIAAWTAETGDDD